MVSVNGVISYAVVTLLIGALSAAVNIKNSDNNNNSIASVPCSSFTACEICAANNCTWVIDKNCAERCTKSGANMRGSINSAPTCSIVSGIPNPSFETYEYDSSGKTKRFPPWMQTKMKATINSSSEDAFDFVGYDGEYFALFGGEEGDYEYQVSLSVIFPEAATHLSFFVSVLSLGFDATSGSSFVLLIDDVSAFAIDEGNFNNYVSDPKSAPRYYPVDIDVRNYADGRMHTIVFVHWQYVTDEGCPSIVFLDFVNFLSKPSVIGNSGAFEPDTVGGRCSPWCSKRSVFKDELCFMGCKGHSNCNYNSRPCGEDEVDEPDVTGVAVVICAAIIIALFLVAVLSVVIFLFIRLEKKSKSEVYTPDKRTEIRKHEMEVDKSLLDFGLGDDLAKVDVSYEDEFTVTNKIFRYASCSVKIPGDITKKSYCAIRSIPQKFVLNKGETTSIKIEIRAFCLTTVSTKIGIDIKDGNEFKGSIPIDVHFKSGMSDRIDHDSIKIDNSAIEEKLFYKVYSGIYRGRNVSVAVYKKSGVDDFLKLEEHKFIARPLGVYTNESLTGTVYEPAPKGNLDALMKQANLSPVMKIKALWDVGRGMAYLHSKGFTSCDLRPENVFCYSFDSNDDVVCKVAFFGRPPRKNVVRSSKGNSVQAKIQSYMAPELLSGEKYDNKVDVYSFGVLVYEVWSEIAAYSDFNSLQSIPDLIINGKRPTLPPTLPNEIADIVKVCWKENPKERPEFSAVVIQLNALYNKIADVTKKDCGLSVDLSSASLSSTSPQGYSTQSIAELGNGESTNMVTIPSVTFNGVQ